MQIQQKREIFIPAETTFLLHKKIIIYEEKARKSRGLNSKFIFLGFETHLKMNEN